MKKKFNLKRILLLSFMLVAVFLPSIGNMRAEAGVDTQISGALGSTPVDTAAELNSLSEVAVEFITGDSDAGKSAKDILDEVATVASGTDNPVKSIAISLIAIYFVVEILSKTTAIDKITMDMIIKVLLQLLVAKLLVDNAGTLLMKIHDFIMSSLGQVETELAKVAVTTEKLSLLKLTPATTNFVIDAVPLGGIVNAASTVALALGFLDNLAQAAGLPAIAIAAKTAVVSALVGVLIGIFLPGVSGIDTGLLGLSSALTGGRSLIILALAIVVRIILYLLVSAFCSITIMITLWMRQIELIVLLFLSPLAMAAFVSDKFRSTTVKFVSHFAAICVQGLVILIICYVADLAFYAGDHKISTWLAECINTFGMLGPVFAAVNDIFPVIIISSLIAKSRSFAQIICGA